MHAHEIQPLTRSALSDLSVWRGRAAVCQIGPSVTVLLCSRHTPRPGCPAYSPRLLLRWLSCDRQYLVHAGGTCRTIHGMLWVTFWTSACVWLASVYSFRFPTNQLGSLHAVPLLRRPPWRWCCSLTHTARTLSSLRFSPRPLRLLHSSLLPRSWACPRIGALHPCAQSAVLLAGDGHFGGGPLRSRLRCCRSSW